MPPESKKPVKESSRAPSKGFTDEEKAAMREYAKERKAAAARGAKSDVDLEPEVLAKIAEMAPGSRAIAERFHALVKSNAPGLRPRLWYGMPAYSRDGDVVCWFQPAEKFKSRYGTVGFSDEAKLDDGHLWPVAYALTELTGVDEARISTLLRQAVG